MSKVSTSHFWGDFQSNMDQFSHSTTKYEIVDVDLRSWTFGVSSKLYDIGNDSTRSEVN